jgi:tRNA-dihydrouridine synthase
MIYSFAPLEGVTNYLYRSCYHAHFTAADRYFTPFIAPNMNLGLNTKELRDVQPEHNRGMVVIPQLLTNRSDYFITAAQKLEQLGYGEINLNLGCPSGTVSAKGKGSGQLADREALERFLDEIYAAVPQKLSIKTRLGRDDPAEFPALMELFNRYPMPELIIHPRIRQDFYREPVRMAWFQLGLDMAKMPVCYNGDLFTAGDVRAFQRQFPTVERVMLGRGLIANPGLLGELHGKDPITAAQFRGFHDDLYERYQQTLSGQKPVLHKMKELWSYWRGSFAGCDKQLKAIRKAQRLGEYESAVAALFSACPMAEHRRFITG